MENPFWRHLQGQQKLPGRNSHKKQCVVNTTQRIPDADDKWDDKWLKPHTTDYNAFLNRKTTISASIDI